MKSRLLLIFFICFSMIGKAQEERYSYSSERKFTDPTDLMGYNFRPAKKETPGDYEAKKIQPGEYSFGVSRSRLYVKGDEELEGMYEINNINTENYGYKLLLLDPRKPSQRGHLKIILTPQGEAEALVFKTRSKAKEIIFHIPQTSSDLKKAESKYFTDLKEVAVESTDSLWGMKIFPYIRKDFGSNRQSRFYEADSTMISFEEVITIKEKKKKKKKSKKKRKKKKDEVTEVVEEAVTEEVTNQVPQEMPAESDEVVKTKTIKEYFVKIRSILKNEDGTTEDKIWTYQIKEILEREDETAKKNEERFQIVLKSGKKEIYLYLNGDRTISSFETEDGLFMMRGH